MFIWPSRLGETCLLKWLRVLPHTKEGLDDPVEALFGVVSRQEAKLNARPAEIERVGWRPVVTA
ncbi:hypothetical protein SAMN05421684_1604 [Asanoa ishikariensis]|uniref:Uncharacterized protein n=1 Tax=Asanoa ishikariensis TaxID=137265 RepID=A0A1H3MTM3_9ACTN|nr:hypothetical protein SAMN05421684_1604 [Asanoa ishikariensis]